MSFNLIFFQVKIKLAMKAIKAIKTRRSVRSFSDKEVSDETVRELIDCARRAPSSHNRQSWQFIVVDKEETKKELSEVHKWASFVEDSSRIIVVCYDKDRTKFMPSGIISPALATLNILLAAHALGLGACWVFVKDFEKKEVEDLVKDILEIPGREGVLAMVPIGYPDQEPEEKELREIEEITHRNSW